MPGMLAGSAANPGAVDPGAQIPSWLLMSLAMALPAALPAAQYVATNSFRRSRSSAVTVFLAVYLLVWLSSGLPAAFVVPPIRGLPARTLFAIALAVAAGYELTPFKRRALNRCHRGTPLPPTGVRRVGAVARFGWLNASGCVATCWPAMFATSIAPVAQPPAMAGFTLAMTYERLTRSPRTARRRIAASYLAIAVVSTAAAF
jgi:predicted metal-binding membrane protein